MFRSSETRLTPSTVVLERELDSTENILRDALAKVTKVHQIMFISANVSRP